MKKILIIMTLVTCLTAWSEPGGTYTLTGEEKSISEIIKADMAQYPELYQGESLDGYISKFNKRNKIGKRTLSPGDQLYFPETMASRKAKKLKLEEEQSKKKEMEEQRERLLEERLNSFTEKNETDWIPEAEFGELIKNLDRKGYWQGQYWVTEIDGRYIDGKVEYKFKYEKAPSDGSRYEFFWSYGRPKEYFEQDKRKYENNVLIMVYEQSFSLPGGEKRYQAVWHKHE